MFPTVTVATLISALFTDGLKNNRTSHIAMSSPAMLTKAIVIPFLLFWDVTSCVISLSIYSTLYNIEICNTYTKVRPLIFNTLRKYNF